MTNLLTLLFWLLFPALLARGVVWWLERGYDE